MARSAEQSSKGVHVAKEPLDTPPMAIHTLGDEVLRTPAKRIGKVDEAVRELARQMLLSMYAAKGIGLAAPQVGVHQQLLVIDVVEVSYRCEMGRSRRIKADGLLARCIQHEMDHLNGVLFVDRVSDGAGLEEGLKEKGFDRAHVRSLL